MLSLILVEFPAPSTIMSTPKKIHIVSVIGSEEGVEHVAKFLPSDTELWIADIDASLNDKGYIVPGLGDAGDLAFGTKMDFSKK